MEKTEGIDGPIGLDEAAILKDIEARFSAQDNKDLIQEIRERGIKGTRL